MNKTFFVQKAGSGRKLAKLLGVTPQAVSKWQEIPPLRVYQLRDLRPKWVAECKRQEERPSA